MTTVEKFTHAGLKVKIKVDEDPPNPRTDFDPFGTFICFHGRYDLGDKDHGFRQEDYNGWTELRADIEKQYPGCICLPLFLYDHGNLYLKVGSFHGQGLPQGHAEFDSGQVGYAIATKEQIKENWIAKRVTAKLRKQADELLRGEVQTYADYLRGAVYGYVIKKDGEELDSCWGIYGLKYAIAEAKSAAEAEVRHLALESANPPTFTYRANRFEEGHPPFERFDEPCTVVRKTEGNAYIVRFADGAEFTAWQWELHLADAATWLETERARQADLDAQAEPA